MKKLIILGNGPSLKEIDLKDIGIQPSLGMNAAYRYWESIDWYPTIYACLDDVVVVTHQEKIKQLILTEKCRIFFLHSNILKSFPELSKQKNVYFLSSFLQGTAHTSIVEKYALPKFDFFYFRSVAPGKITTGSYSIRFGAFLGFEEFYLCGIDLKYVEVLPEAQKKSDLMLEIQSTPIKNPNYFFDFYQQKGDKYNIPNPTVHMGNLHLQSFEALKEDFKKNAPYISLYTATKNTLLYENNLFSYKSLSLMQSGKNRLDAVFISATEKEFNDVLYQLEDWSTPEASPYICYPKKPSVDLCVVFNRCYNESFTKQLTSIFKKKIALNQSFSSFKVLFANLSDKEDVYNKSKTGKIGKFGYVDGPNHLFYKIFSEYSLNYSSFLLLETDCRVIRSGWLEKMKELAVQEDFWIKGSYYRGFAKPISFLHTNGCALYNSGNKNFRDFVSKIKEYYKERSKQHKSLSFDVIVWDYFRDVFSRKADDDLIQEWKGVYHYFKYTSFIQDYTSPIDFKFLKCSNRYKLRVNYPDAYILHGRQFLESANNDKIPTFLKNCFKFVCGTEYNQHISTKDFSKVNFNVWEWNPELATQQSLSYLAFVFKFEPTSLNRNLTAGCLIKLTKKCTLRFSLARHSNSPYEAFTEDIEIVPNEWHKVDLYGSFTKKYTHGKLQIEITKLYENNEQVNIEIKDLYLVGKLVRDLSHVDKNQHDFVVFSLNPDLKSEFGHYFHYDNKLRKSFSQRKAVFFSLANVNVEPPLNKTSWLHPILPFRSYEKLENIEDDVDKDVKSSFKIISQTMKEFKLSGLVYFYMLAHWNTSYFAKTIDLGFLGDLNVTFNLSCIYFPAVIQIKSSNIKPLLDNLSSIDQLVKNPHILVTTDSEKIKEFVYHKLSVRLLLIPTFALNQSCSKVKSKSLKHNKTIYFPGNAQKSKGFDLLPLFAKELKNFSHDNSWKFVTRFYVANQREMDELLLIKNSLLSEDIQVIDGVLTQEEYDQHINRSSIIILPYRRDRFYNRTSGQLLEALLCKKPVVATKETWLGEVVDRFNCGETFNDGDAEAMALAVKKVISNYQYYVNNCNSFISFYNRASTENHLVDLLIEIVNKDEKCSLIVANKMFRNGEYEKATRMYSKLFEFYHKEMYLFTVVHIMRRKYLPEEFLEYLPLSSQVKVRQLLDLKVVPFM